jgi:transposase
MRKLGYTSNKKQQKFMEGEKDKLENLVEQERIRVLEQRLREAELKAIAYSKMIDIAEKEFKISIRKKFNTKPSKR